MTRAELFLIRVVASGLCPLLDILSIARNGVFPPIGVVKLKLRMLTLTVFTCVAVYSQTPAGNAQRLQELERRQNQTEEQIASVQKELHAVELQLANGFGRIEGSVDAVKQFGGLLGVFLTLLTIVSLIVQLSYERNGRHPQPARDP